MKNTLIFLAGVAVGAASAIIWLRKDIKKRIAEIENSKKQENNSDLPFEMGENGEEEAKNGASNDENADKVTSSEPVSVKNETRIKYNKIINKIKNSDVKTLDTQQNGQFVAFQDRKEPVPIMPREDLPPNIDENLAEIDEIEGVSEEEDIVPRSETFFEIDRDDFDHDDEYLKVRYVYFRGDRVMCTESGTVITNPYLFVGNQWEQFVGNYAQNTAFVRNTRLREDYEIYVEEGTYADEYGYDSL